MGKDDERKDAGAERRPDDVATGKPPDEIRVARDEAIVEALGCGATHHQAADMAGVSAKSVQRLLTNPDFRSRVALRRRERLQQVTGLLIRASDDAITALVEVARAAPPRDRVAAAVQLLALSRRHHSADVLEGEVLERLAALESPSDESEGNPR